MKNFSPGLLICFIVLGLSPTYAQTAVVHEGVYDGRGVDTWVSEVLRLATTIRRAEEAYEKDVKECTEKRRKMDPNRLSCIRANQALALSQSTRAEYQQLLDQASTTSLDIEWLKAHFTWARWGEEWKRNQNP